MKVLLEFKKLGYKFKNMGKKREISLKNTKIWRFFYKIIYKALKKYIFTKCCFYPPQCARCGEGVPYEKHVY